MLLKQTSAVRINIEYGRCGKEANTNDITATTHKLQAGYTKWVSNTNNGATWYLQNSTTHGKGLLQQANKYKITAWSSH